MVNLMPTPAIWCIISFFVSGYESWKAIPANQALYAARSNLVGIERSRRPVVPDDQLPRNTLHSIYKFGWCTRDSTVPQFLRRKTNYTLPDFKSADTKFIYLLETARHTIRFKLQCIVVKVYVAKKFQFQRSRIPFYYCQGHLVYLMMNTIDRVAIHEFYFPTKFKLPATFLFEFYHPTVV